MTAAAAAALQPVLVAKERCRFGPGAAMGEEARERTMRQVREEVERSRARTAQADVEQRIREASSASGPLRSRPEGLRGPVRIMARIRPLLAGEDSTEWLRVCGQTRVEVLLETPRQSTNLSATPVGVLGTPHSPLTHRGRRRTTGGDCVGRHVPAERKAFFFDHAFGMLAGDDEVFASIRAEVAAVVEGEAVCVLVYGAAGSGRSYNVAQLAACTGHELERRAACFEAEGMRLEVGVQVVEVYNEQVRDLLNVQHEEFLSPQLRTPVSASACTRTLRCTDGRGILPGVTEALHDGETQRAMASLPGQARASRSHLVLTLLVSVCDLASGTIRTAGKLSFVDLAGSDRLAKNDATPEQLRQAQHIGRSLGSLADVIMARERHSAHIPFRNSKLTYVLQDALGGQELSRAVLLVTLSPQRSAAAETVRSLQYGTRLTALPLTNSAQTCLETHRLATPGAKPDESFDGDEEDLQNEVERLRAGARQARVELADTARQLVRRELELFEVHRASQELQRTELRREQLVDSLAKFNTLLTQVEAKTTDIHPPVLHQTSARDAARPPPPVARSTPHLTVPTVLRASNSANIDQAASSSRIATARSCHQVQTSMQQQQQQRRRQTARRGGSPSSSSPALPASRLANSGLGGEAAHHSSPQLRGAPSRGRIGSPIRAAAKATHGLQLSNLSLYRTQQQKQHHPHQPPSPHQKNLSEASLGTSARSPTERGSPRQQLAVRRHLPIPRWREIRRGNSPPQKSKFPCTAGNADALARAVPTPARALAKRVATVGGSSAGGASGAGGLVARSSAPGSTPSTPAATGGSTLSAKGKTPQSQGHQLFSRLLLPDSQALQPALTPLAVTSETDLRQSHVVPCDLDSTADSSTSSTTTASSSSSALSPRSSIPARYTHLQTPVPRRSVPPKLDLSRVFKAVAASREELGPTWNDAQHGTGSDLCHAPRGRSPLRWCSTSSAAEAVEHRLQSPREGHNYEVAVLSPQTARVLTGRAVSAAPTGGAATGCTELSPPLAVPGLAAEQPPASPPLLLWPGSQDCSEPAVPRSMARTASSVSLSSDEGEIRARLWQRLQRNKQMAQDPATLAWLA